MNSCCNTALASAQIPGCNLQRVLGIMYLGGLEDAVEDGGVEDVELFRRILDLNCWQEGEFLNVRDLTWLLG